MVLDVDACEAVSEQVLSARLGVQLSGQPDGPGRCAWSSDGVTVTLAFLPTGAPYLEHALEQAPYRSAELPGHPGADVQLVDLGSAGRLIARDGDVALVATVLDGPGEQQRRDGLLTVAGNALGWARALPATPETTTAAPSAAPTAERDIPTGGGSPVGAGAWLVALLSTAAAATGTWLSGAGTVVANTWSLLR